MTRVRRMLETYPGNIKVDADVLERTIEALEDCANTCTQCADACLAERDVSPLARCIRLNLDCADVCIATSRVISRLTAHDAILTRSLLEACIAACRSCGDECEHHAEQLAHCRVCAETCRECEETCREALTEVA